MARISRKNYANTIAADAMAPCVFGPSAFMLLAVWDLQINCNDLTSGDSPRNAPQDVAPFCRDPVCCLFSQDHLAVVEVISDVLLRESMGAACDDLAEELLYFMCAGSVDAALTTRLQGLSDVTMEQAERVAQKVSVMPMSMSCLEFDAVILTFSKRILLTKASDAGLWCFLQRLSK